MSDVDEEIFKIPKPPSCYDDELKTLETLFHAMIKTHDTPYQFEKFKKLVRAHFVHLELDLEEKKANQDPKKWNELVKRILEEDGRLRQYECYWPIETYFNAHVKWHLKMHNADATPQKTPAPHSQLRKQVRNFAVRKENKPVGTIKDNKPASSTPASKELTKPMYESFREWQQNQSASASALSSSSTLVNSRLSFGTTTPNKKASASASAPFSARSMTTVTKTIRYISGKTPKHMRTISLSLGRATSPTPAQKTRAAARNTSTSAFDIDASQASASQKSISANGSQAPLWARAPSPALKPIQATQPKPALEQAQHHQPAHPTSASYPSPCFRCGRLPTLPAPLTQELHALFPSTGEEAHYLPTLTTSGLLHDAHLRLFLSWPSTERAAFVASMPGDQITPLDRVLIARRFEESVDRKKGLKRKLEEEGAIPGGNIASRKAAVLAIPQPNLEAETRLTDPSNPPILLRLAMKVQNDAEYEVVIATMNMMTNEYLACFNTKGQADQERLDRIVRAIHEHCPALRRYENDWAIKFYMKRRMQQSGGSALHTSQGEEKISNSSAGPSTLSAGWYSRAKAAGSSKFTLTPPPKADDKANPAPPLPTAPIPIPTCPIHAPLDITSRSPSMQAFLAARGMQELAPALVMAGVHTDAQFQKFLTLGEAEQTALLTADDGLVKVSRFQQVMLRVAFRAVTMKKEDN